MSTSDDIKQRYPVYQFDSDDDGPLTAWTDTAAVIVHSRVDARYIEECTRLRQAYEEWKAQAIGSGFAWEFRMLLGDFFVKLDAAMKGEK